MVPREIISEISSEITKEQIEKALIQQLEAQVPPKPPTGFDPLQASDEDLVKFALPRKPPPGNEGALEIWKAIVGTAALQTQSAAINFVVASDYGIGSAGATFPGAQETSQNWSGIVTRDASGSGYTQVYGQWQVPQIGAPLGTLLGKFRCSTWIGLDGHDWTSPAMPQLGITMKVDTTLGISKVSYEAWVQWWSRAFSAQYKIAPVVLQGFKVEEGDVISCAIDVIDPLTANVSIANETNGMSISQPLLGEVTVNTGVPPIIFSVRLGPVSGTTAEWIAERPALINKPTSLFRLPVFDKVKFLSATVQKPPLPPGPVRTICMVQPIGGPNPRLRVLSRAHRGYAGNNTQTVTIGPGLEHAMGG